MIRWPRDWALASVAESPAGALGAWPAAAVAAPAAVVAAAAVVGAEVVSDFSSLPQAVRDRPAARVIAQSARSFMWFLLLSVDQCTRILERKSLARSVCGSEKNRSGSAVS